MGAKAPSRDQARLTEWIRFNAAFRGARQFRFALCRQPNDYLFLPDFAKSRNVGFALNKDEPRFKEAINRALLDIEETGEAASIFDAWFGPGSQEPMQRSFRIRPD